MRKSNYSGSGFGASWAKWSDAGSRVIRSGSAHAVPFSLAREWEKSHITEAHGSKFRPSLWSCVAVDNAREIFIMLVVVSLLRGEGEKNRKMLAKLRRPPCIRCELHHVIPAAIQLARKAAVCIVPSAHSPATPITPIRISSHPPFFVLFPSFEPPSRPSPSPSGPLRAVNNPAIPKPLSTLEYVRIWPSLWRRRGCAF